MKSLNGFSLHAIIIVNNIENLFLIRTLFGSAMEPQSCWEFWDCPKEQRGNCPAFLNYNGKECYSFAENYCPKLAMEFERCWECPWFKKIRPDFKLEESNIKD